MQECATLQFNIPIVSDYLGLYKVFCAFIRKGKRDWKVRGMPLRGDMRLPGFIIGKTMFRIEPISLGLISFTGMVIRGIQPSAR